MRFLLICILTFCYQFHYGQSIPKKFANFKYFAEGKKLVARDAEIISRAIVNEPIINEIFPNANFYKFGFKPNQGPRFDFDTCFLYLMHYKGLFYNINYLSFLELKTNKGKINHKNIKERLSAYSTISVYKKVQALVKIDSIIKIDNYADSSNFHIYKVIYSINGKKHEGKTQVINGFFQYFTIWDDELKVGGNYTMPIDNKNITYP